MATVATMTATTAKDEAALEANRDNELHIRALRRPLESSQSTSLATVRTRLGCARIASSCVFTCRASTSRAELDIAVRKERGTSVH